MKVLVTGSRSYANYTRMKEEIVNSGADIIIHGGAKGADSLAGEVATQRGLVCRVYQAQWDKFGKAAGSKRNQEMLDKEHTKDEPVDLVLAFPVEGSIGTLDMMRRAERAGIPVKVIKNG